MKQLFTLIAAFFVLNLHAQTFIAAYSKSPQSWGYLNTDGRELTEPIYKSVSDFSTDGYATAVETKSGQAVLIKKDGSTVELPVEGIVDLQYIGEHEKMADKKCLIFKKGSQHGLMTISGKVLHEAVYDKIHPTPYSFAVAHIDKQHYLLNFDGTVVTLPADIVDVRNFDDGCAPFKRSDNLMGFIDTKGAILIPAAYASVGYFESGLAWAKTPDDQVGFIDKTGKWVIQANYDMAKEFDARTQRALAKRGDTFVFLKPDGTEITVENTRKLGQFHEGLAFAATEDFVGAVNADGEWVVQPTYDRVEEFVHGFARVKKGSLWGFVDKTGQEILPPTYARLEDFHDQRAPFYDGKKWGYLDEQGKIVIPATFDDYDHFHNGFAVVKKGKLTGLIDTNGTFVIEAKYAKVKPVTKVD